MNILRRIFKRSNCNQDGLRYTAVKYAAVALKEKGYSYEKYLGRGSYGDVIAVTTNHDNDSLTYKKRVERRIFEDNLKRSSKNGKSSIAVKIIFEEEINEGEMTIWPMLQHQNVLPLLDTISLPGLQLFLMPRLNQSLEEVIERNNHKKNPFGLMKTWMIDVLKGLDYLHRRQQLCHLDLKADNVLLTSDSRAVICDFSFINITSQRTRSYGLPVFLRPHETCPTKGEYPEVEGSSFDMWSFGMLCLCSFTNKYHHLESIKSWKEDVYPLIFDVLQTNHFHRLVNQRYPLVSKDQVNMILKLILSVLRRDPEQRPTASEVLKSNLFSGGNKVLTTDAMWINEAMFSEKSASPKNGTSEKSCNLFAIFKSQRKSTSKSDPFEKLYNTTQDERIVAVRDLSLRLKTKDKQPSEDAAIVKKCGEDFVDSSTKYLSTCAEKCPERLQEKNFEINCENISMVRTEKAVDPEENLSLKLKSEVKQPSEENPYETCPGKDLFTADNQSRIAMNPLEQLTIGYPSKLLNAGQKKKSVKGKAYRNKSMKPKLFERIRRWFERKLQLK